MKTMVKIMCVISCLLVCVSGQWRSHIPSDHHDASMVTDFELNPVKAGVEYLVHVYRWRRNKDEIGSLAVDNQTCPPTVVAYSFGTDPRELELIRSTTMSLHPVTPSSDGNVRRDTPVYMKLGQDAVFSIPAGCNNFSTSSPAVLKVGTDPEYDESKMIVTTGGEMGDLQTSGIFVAHSVQYSPRTNRFTACPVISSPTASNNATCRPIIPFQNGRNSSDNLYRLGLGDPKRNTVTYETRGPIRFIFIKK